MNNVWIIKNNMDFKCNPTNLFIDAYYYNEWCKEEDEQSTGITTKISLAGNEEWIKQEERLKILTPNKLLTRLLVLLAQMETGNNS